MKITVKQYALALFESVAAKNKKDTKKAVEEFAQVLRDNNHLALVNKIIEKFILIYNQKEGIVEAELISAEKLGNDTKKDLISYIKKISQAEKVEITEKEDKKMIGGTVIKYGDKILDLSLRSRMQNLKNELKK